jgi:hypothetical protein
LLSVSRTIGFALLCGIAAATAAAVVPAHAEDYAVVVSAGVTIEDSSLEGIRDIFAFRRRFWSPTRPITILYSSESLEKNSVMLRQIYGKDIVGLRRLILENINRGDLDFAPKVVATDQLAVQFVAAGEGLIALVKRSAADAPGLRILAVDGKKPGHPQYPLRR